MSTRRLEVSVKQFKEKISHQMLELSRTREELVKLTAERDEKQQAISTLEAQGVEPARRIEGAGRGADESRRGAGGGAVGTRQAHPRAGAGQSAAAGDMPKSPTAARSSWWRATRKSARCRTNSANTGASKRILRHQAREIELESRALQESLKQERKRHADADKKIERLTAQLSDREEKLERREKEFARLREQMKLSTLDGHDVDKRLVAADRVRLGLEAEVAELTARLASLLGNARGGDIELAFRKLEDDREKLKQRVGELTRANKALEEKLAQGQLAHVAGLAGRAARHGGAARTDQRHRRRNGADDGGARRAGFADHSGARSGRARPRRLPPTATRTRQCRWLTGCGRCRRRRRRNSCAPMAGCFCALRHVSCPLISTAI